MREAEHRALLRAAVLLMGISVLRWLAAVGGPGTADVGATDVDALPDHQAATAAALTEAEERALPLAEGERIDPNTATEVQLDRLPGVGPATARAIIAARDTGIVFRRTNDLLVVRGIGPSSLERVRPWIASSGAGRPRAAPRQTSGPIDVNRADVEALQTLPGIGPALAARIVAERLDRPFESLEDLIRVQGIGPSTLVRLRPLARAGPRR